MESNSCHLVSDEPLDRFFLSIESRKESLDVHIKSSAGTARVSLREGRLVDAEFGDLLGLDAVSAVLRLRDGNYTCETGKDLSSRSMSYRVSEVIPATKPDAPAALASSDGSKDRGVFALAPRVSLTEKPMTTAGKTMTGWSPAAKSRPHGLQAVSEPVKLEATTSSAKDKSEKKKGPPGRWAADSATPYETRYSSVPPPLLAEERVVLPSSRSGADMSGQQRRHPSSGRSGAALRQATAPAQKARQPIDKRELDEEVVRAARGQLRESEMPVPSSRLDPDALRQLDMLNEALASSPAHLPELDDPGSLDSHSPFPVDLKSQPPEVAGEFTMRSRGLPNRSGSSAPPVPSSTRSPLEPLDSPKQVDSPEPPLPSSVAPSSDTGSLRQPVPGSVPHPNLLPGGAAAQGKEGGLPTVGRYQVLARLKRGGMGSVYMCRLSGSAGFRRLFAMKVLHGHLKEQPGALDAFVHEALVLGNLRHRNIVGIADVGSATDPYIVLEYVEGGSLAELYRATKKAACEPAVIVSIVLDALSGLGAAHVATDERGHLLDLVHCDVTPHNLLVGIDGTCRLTDFGIARTGYIDPQDEVVQGKPGYLAPERIRRLASDARSDIFSLGVVFYAGLTGVEPFSADSSEGTMKNVLEARVEAPSKVGFRPPACFDEICLRALAKDPNERFQSAQEMAEQLRRVALQERLLGSPEEVAAWVRKHLSPTLEARRIASMRGAASAEEQRNWATLPPPAVAPGPDSSPPEANSAAENTRPLDDQVPVSSHRFDDRTEMLTGPQTVPQKAATATLVRYLLVTLVMAGLVWVVLQPGSLNSLLSLGAKSTTDEPNLRDENSQEQPRPVSHPNPDADPNPDRIVIPDINPE